ncbi:hypothetical protein [Streptomyces sp. NPDC050263]|uniref:hypothetical protein n=1 Tax=Streptomyces sp. NPDC050263 TaxID=3155037 RepID=UPI0034419676
MGRTWVIQCKHRAAGDRGSAVGTLDLQRVNGTARQLSSAHSRAQVRSAVMVESSSP